MKKLYLLLFVALTSLFISCDKDDTDTTITNESLILGEWNLVSFVREGKNTAFYPGGTDIETYTTTGKEFDYSLIFSKNPNEVYGGGTIQIEKISSLTDRIITGQDYGKIESTSWSMENNQLLMEDLLTNSNTGIDYPHSIIKLNENELHLILEFEFKQEYDSDTYLISEGTATYVFSK